MILNTILMFALPVLVPIGATILIDRLFLNMTKGQLFGSVIGSSIILPLVVLTIAFSSNDDNGQAASWLVASILFFIGAALSLLTRAARRMA